MSTKPENFEFDRRSRVSTAQVRWLGCLCLLVGAVATAPLIASAQQYVFEADEVIEAQPFNDMFTELYGRVGAVEDQVTQAVPIGAIVMWSGALDTIPLGWVLCDGSDGTPDLRDRFIVGAGDGYVPADVGGEASVALTVAQLPAHSHGYSGHIHVPNPGFLVPGSPWGVGYPDWPGFDTQTTSTGSGEAHNNLPPYYALAYIMKM